MCTPVFFLLRASPQALRNILLRMVLTGKGNQVNEKVSAALASHVTVFGDWNLLSSSKALRDLN